MRSDAVVGLMGPLAAPPGLGVSGVYVSGSRRRGRGDIVSWVPRGFGGVRPRMWWWVFVVGAVLAGPASVASGSALHAKAVSVGVYHTCAIEASDGSLACWGYNADGEASVPAGLGAVRAVSAGGFHTCAIKTSDGSLACWGNNDYGQASVPAGLGAVTAVSAGYAHTCAIKASDGSLACWGYNSNGQASAPAGLGAVTAAGAGGFHTCAVKADRSLACWGYSGYGLASVPAGLGAVTAVSAGYYHTCVITADGSVACWGNNDFGQTSVPAGPDTPQLTVSEVAAIEGQQISGQVSTFTDTGSQSAGDYSATITWGDGESSAGTVSQTAAGQYAITASHKYADEGSFPVTVELTDTDGASVQSGATATVTDASVAASGRGSASSPVATTRAFAAQVATLTDQNPGGSASDFMATIDWGDGQSSAGTVSQTTGGAYSVSGSHPYAADGPYTVKVHVVDDGGAGADTTSYIVVYEYADQTGGSFVIGDQNSGPSVYFWGAQWAQHNPMSVGTGPSSFKGFAENSAQSCGQTFTSRAGNSSSPPATLPPYVAVAVSTSVLKSRSTISGSVDKLVVVNTGRGYGPDPGSPGTGQIVATICG